MNTHRRLTTGLNLVLIVILLTGLFGVQPASAQIEPPTGKPAPGPEGLTYAYNPDTGLLTFVGGSAAAPLLDPAQSAGALADVDAGAQVLAQYGQSFGLRNPAEELRLERVDQHTGGATLRYQQQISGIPVLGGELLLNRDADGRMLSLNGEVSPNLKLRNTRPSISAERARNTAVAGMKAWHGLSASQVQASQPELWVYDPNIFEPTDAAPVLTWRVELAPLDTAAPVRELVLVNAANGRVALHFNQVNQISQVSEDQKDILKQEGLQSSAADVQLENNVLAQVDSTIWYVALWGIDTNDCLSPSTPCETINHVIRQAQATDTIMVAAGNYPVDVQGKISISKSLNLHGGWNHDFDIQTGQTVLDGQNKRHLMDVTSDYFDRYIDVSLSRFTFINGFDDTQDYRKQTSALFVGIATNFTIRDSSFHHNAQTPVHVSEASSFTAINTTIAETRGSSYGSLRIFDTHDVHLQNLTVVNNETAVDSAGLWFDSDFDIEPSTTIHIKNTIVANNTGPHSTDCLSTNRVRIISEGYNLIEEPGSCIFTPGPGDLTGQDPLLSALNPKGFYTLLPGSPALDGGSVEEPGLASACEPTDQTGSARPMDGNGDGIAVCDMGAFENIEPTFTDYLEIWDEPQQILQIDNSNNLSRVRALGVDGLPLVGARVLFSAPSDGPSGVFADGMTQIEVITDSDGIATAPIFVTNQITGYYTIEASLESAANPAQLQLENYAPYPFTLKPIAGNQQVTAPGQEFPDQLQVLVRDQHGRPLGNTPVTFSAPDTGAGGWFSDSETNITTVFSTNDGIAVAPVFHANDLNGAYLVTAQTDGVDKNADFVLSNTDYFYLSPTGSDILNTRDNSCRFPETPCRSYQHVSPLLNDGSTVLIQAGTYEMSFASGRIQINKDVSLSGGWDSTYSMQIGLTYFVGNNISRPGISIGPDRKSNIDGISVMGFAIGIEVLQSDVVVSDCALIDNYQGIVITHSSVVVQNCVISKNDIGVQTGPKTKILYSTIADNSKFGIKANRDSSVPPNPPQDDVLLTNNIITRNAFTCQADIQITSLGHNILDRKSPCGSGARYTSNPSDLHGVDPQISPLINNSHYALAATSPAIDAIAAGEECPAHDIRRVSRPENGFCDIGSFEYKAPGPAVRLLTYSMLSQVTAPGIDFTNLLQVLAIDSFGSLVPGETITFTAPDSGAGAFLHHNGATTVSVITDVHGTATTPLLRANEQFGAYNVTAALNNNAFSLSFQLANGTPARHVDTRTGDDLKGSNSCLNPSSPCKTVNHAIKQADPDNLILVAEGTYREVVLFPGSLFDGVANIDKNIVISGGWDSSFTRRSGRTIFSAGEPDDGIVVKGDVNALVDGVDLTENVVGLRITSGTLKLSESNIYQNRRGIEAGTSGSVLEVVNTAVTRNLSGISNNGGLKLTNVNLSDNICSETRTNECSYATGFVNGKDGKAELTNVTIANNRTFFYYPSTSQYYSGGIYNHKGDVQMVNSILAHNHNDWNYDCVGEITSLGHNLIGNSAGCSVQPVQGDVIGTQEHPADPLLGYNDHYDSIYETIPLLTGSPAIDSADPSFCPLTDLRGAQRPAGAGCDMGAHEGVLVSDPLPTIITYSADNTERFPHRWLCQSPQQDCTGGEDLEADAAHNHAFNVHQMYFDVHRRSSIDDAGMAVISTVHSAAADNNAFWSGHQLVFGDGFVVDDVFAHEYTHGVTQSTSRLFNYYQSGAISESISDVWGEYYDQTNGLGNDATEVRWLIGEDLPIGAIRSMSNPPQFKHPDSMSSKNYSKSPNDNGSVHANSGVNNKAVFLMVDGGTFHSLTVAPIGWEKTLALYYYAQTHLITSGAGYDDLYSALNQSCSMLTGGTEGLTSADCQQVQKALFAVRMSQSHKTGFNPTASACPSNTYRVPGNLFFDDFENGDDQWIFGSLILHHRDNLWKIISGAENFYYTASGDHAMFVDNSIYTGSEENVYAAIDLAIEVPKTGKTMLFFTHAYGFEYFTYHRRTYYIDGGVLEYEIDGDDNWRDAKSLFSAGQNYPGRLFNAKYKFRNPLFNRSAFRGESHGYVDSRYDLTKLAGKTVRFRWRMGKDNEGYLFGWIVDDVAIYNCVGKPATPSLKLPSNNLLVTSYQPRLDWNNSSNAHTYDLQIAGDSAFTNKVLDESNITSSEYTLLTPLQPNTRYYWRARSINAAGVTSKWSSARSFRTAMITPVLQTPPDGSTTETARPLFEWSASPGATSYSIQVSRFASFKSNTISATAKTNSYTATRSLTSGTLYYWRVRANGSNTSAWSAPASFTVP